MPKAITTPLPPDFCSCVSCRKKNGYPGHSGWDLSTAYHGVGGHYGTRDWNPQGRGPMFFGFELELCNASSAAWRAAFNRISGGVIAEVKPDGSLMEITCHPMSLPYLLDHYPWDMLPELYSLGAYGDPGYGGLHVHAAKDGFDGADHMFRWWKLTYANLPQMTRIGGRPRNFRMPSEDAMRRLAEQNAAESELRKRVHVGAAHAVKRPRGMFLRDADLVAIREAEQHVFSPRNYDTWRSQQSGEINGVIAVSRHHTTFEARFPGATTVIDEAKARVELIAAGIEFARETDNTSWDAFRSFAGSNRRYRELSAVMA